MNFQRLKRLIKKLFFLPPPATLLVAVPSFVLVFWVLGSGRESSLQGYFSYGLSAYGTVISVTGARSIVKWAKAGIKNNPLAKRLTNIPAVGKYLENARFRTEISLYTGLGINLAYVIIKLLSGILCGSVWLITLAVYYALLAVMRLSLLHYVRKREENKAMELRRYRLCGIVLLMMNEALVVIIILAITENIAFEYPGPLIYAMAVYAFYAAAAAVINVIKYKKYASPFMSAAKVINLTAALVSVLSLTTAMLARFGGADSAFRRLMIGATGAGVGIIVLSMAVYMIAVATRRLKDVKA